MRLKPTVMIYLLIGVQAPIQQDIIKIIEKKPALVQKVPEQTVDQKIKSNFYKCNTEIQYIRKDNARCLDKPKTTQTRSSANKAQKALESPRNQPGNTYQAGQCVWYIKNLRPELPNTWGSAVSWLANAQADGWPTGTEPRVGAVGWTSGHVVLITAVNTDGTVDYTDMNGRWIPYEIGNDTAPSSKYFYIY